MSKLITEYEVVFNAYPLHTMEQTDEYLDEGWEIFGELVVTSFPAKQIWIQPLVKSEVRSKPEIIDRYEITCRSSIPHLVIEVNEKIIEGWQPLGSLVASMDDENKPLYNQVMVKYVT